MQLYKSKFVTINLLPNNVLYVNWENYQTAQSIIETGDMMLQIIKKHSIKNVLNDNSLVKGTWTFPDAMNYINNVWIKGIMAAKLKKFAWIYSPDVFSKFAADRVINKTEELFQKFGSYDEAYNWINS